MAESDRVCDQCESATSTISCEDCQLKYCEDCDKRRHMKGTLQQHKRETSARKCEMCSKLLQSIKCVDCDIVFCEPCDLEMHKKGALKNHVRTRNGDPPIHAEPLEARDSKSTTIDVHMPTTVFGYTKRSCSSEELKKKYPFAHFENPVNIKHRLVNQWGLNMAASSRGRFNKQRDHTKWCMDERSNRLSLQLATTEAEEVSFETNYYQEKSIRFKLKTLNQKYADVKNLELGKTKQHQSDRFHAYAANFRQITEAADNVLERIQTRLQLVGNGPSRKEEQNFYKGQRKVATKLIDEIHDQLEKINDLEEEFKRKYPDRPILAKSKSKRLKKKYTARCEKEKKRESEELKKRKTYQDYWEKQEWGSNEEKHEKVNDSDDNMAKERPDEVNDSDDSMAGERPEVNDSDDIMAGERPEVNDSDDIMADGERPEVNDLDDIMAGERNDEGSDFYDNMADAINSVMDTDNESETSVSEEKHTDMIDLSNDLDISDSDTDSETSSSDSSSDSED